MNIAMIMSGGVGKRFGSVIPKQYNLINGRPVIDYVIESCKKSELTDRIVVVCDPQCIQFSSELRNKSVDIAPNGSERCYSLENGFNYIKENYNCDNICILDAVAPFVYPDLIDDYFRKLTDYDVVITCQKITGELGNYDYDIMDRSKFYMSQSPEAFRFPLLMEHFDPEFPSSELANQLPKNTKRYLNFDFKHNLKITYDFDLKYASHMIDYFREQQKSKTKIYEKEDFVTEGLNSYLLRCHNIETNKWLEKIAENYNFLSEKWQLGPFIANRTSRFGLVLITNSKIYGDVILKFIPDFIDRYDSEVSAYETLSQSFMCKMIEKDDENRAILLRQIKPAKYAKFEDNIALTHFFENVFHNKSDADGQAGFIDYFCSLKDKLNEMDDVQFCKNDIRRTLEKAIALYEKYFSDEKLYLIHGDLHEFNIIKDENEYAAVDPIGFRAPIEFEFTRFIRNDVLKNRDFGMAERFSLLLGYFSKWVDKDSLAIAAYIDMAYTTFNSCFEFDNDTQTRLNLEYMDIIDKNIPCN